MTDTIGVNPYLHGNFAPVAEEITAFDLPVIGKIPAALEGRYLRNGPNPMSDAGADTHHWFLGDGMVHGIRLRDGRAEWYRNRYVGSTAVQLARGRTDIPGRNWNDAPRGPNTNVGGFAGTTWAMVEAGACPVELTYDLETVGRNDFGGTLPGAFTAHPKVDPLTGEMHAVVYAYPHWHDHLQYVVVGVDGHVRRTVDIPVAGMPMVHDMSLTSTYAIVYDFPVSVDIELAMHNRFPFRWNPDHGSRLGFLPREADADAIVWVDAPICYSFHPMNAFDTADGGVVIDLCVFERMFDGDLLGPFGDCLPRLERWTVHPGRGTCRVDVVDERSAEFPRVRNSVNTAPYRYGYAASPGLGPEWSTVKFDLHTGERTALDHGAGRGAGEPVFVARPDGESEDDGWLLTFVHDVPAAAAEFVVVDARDLSVVARVPLPQRVPYGFHGNWVSDRSVSPG